MTIIKFKKILTFFSRIGPFGRPVEVVGPAGKFLTREDIARTGNSLTCGDTAGTGMPVVATLAGESGNALEAGSEFGNGSTVTGKALVDVEGVVFELVVIVVSDKGTSGNVGVVLELSGVVVAVAVTVLAVEVCGWLVNIW